MPLQDRCRHFRQVTQMLHEALDARRKILPCERHPAHVGYREARFPWPLDTYPTVAAPAEADHREARRGCLAEVVVHALVPWCPCGLTYVPQLHPRESVPRTSLFG